MKKLLLLFVLFAGLTWGQIAFDATVDGGTSSGATLTFSHTCSASANPYLLVYVLGNTHSVDTTCTGITGATYNSASMTLLLKQTPAGSNRCSYMFGLAAPTSGAHNIVVSSTSSGNSFGAISASYTGVSQTGQPDASTSQENAATQNISESITTVADNSWPVYAGTNALGANSAISNLTLRTSAGIFTSSFLGDSNAAVTPAGSYTQTVGATGSTAWTTIQISLKPATSGPTPAQSSAGFWMAQ